MRIKMIDAIGWLGALLVVIAYLMNSFVVADQNLILYQALNLIGSFLIVCYTLHKKAYPNTALNLIWMAIALTALIQLIFRSHH